MERPSGKLVVISGPSGVGKTTILRLLLERLPQLVPSVSATTRPPRAGERDGLHYHFLSAGEFDRRRAAGDFLECCRVYGRQHWYGTLVDEVAPRLDAGRWVVLEIDVEGTLSILGRYPDAVTIFIEPRHPEQLHERLTGRGTESPEAMARRLEVAHRELHEAHHYRHRVVNDNDVAAAVTTIERILHESGLPDGAAGGDRPGSQRHGTTPQQSAAEHRADARTPSVATSAAPPSPEGVRK
jgi:guanylate kinase